MPQSHNYTSNPYKQSDYATIVEDQKRKLGFLLSTMKRLVVLRC